MNILNSIRLILLLLNICMAMYIIFLSGQLLWLNDDSEESTSNSYKELNNMKIPR